MRTFGSGSTLILDGKTIKSGYTSNGSGTFQNGVLDPHSALEVMAHEFGHYLFGSTHYTGVGYHGLMDGNGTGVMTSFERIKLGWLSPINVTTNQLNVEITDAISTNVVYKIPVPNSNHYFLVDNHQRENYYESSWRKYNGGPLLSPGTGLLISHCTPNSIDIESAFGRWAWKKSGNLYLYPFEVDYPNRHTGEDKLNLRNKNTIAGNKKNHPDFLGSPGDYYNMNYKRVFAPWTNPATRTSGINPSNNSNISVVLKEDNNGLIKVDFYVNEITISENTTFPSEEFEFSHNLIVPNGKTLSLEPGTTLKFKNGSKLIINGSLNVQGSASNKVILDFLSPNSFTENGIILNNGTFEDSLMYVKIKNAYRGITVNEIAPFINYAEITNCETGIYMYKSDYELTMNEGSKILNSDISANQTGIYLNESSPQFISNNISSNNIAIEMTNESAPVFGEYLEPGVNTFSANEYNIIAIRAYPILGIHFSGKIGEDYVGGFNQFTGSSYQFVSVDDNGYVMAELNWWDGSPPDPNMFDEISGTIDYDPWLDNPSSPLKGGGNEDNSVFVSGNSSIYNKILIDIAKNDINEAWRSLKNKLNETPSMFGIFLLKTLSNNTIVSDSSKIIMQQLSLNNNLDEETRAYAKLSLINKRNNNNFTGQLNQTANSIQNNNIKGLALFKLFSHYYFAESDKESASQVLSRMKTASVSEKWITEAEKLLGNYQQINKPNAINNNQEYGNEITMGNYPNPFNPITNINFNLPERSLVELSVYNILGQKVVTLKNEILDTGSYSVLFDASKLPSGIYIYNLRSGSFNKSAKMLLLK